jgi:hypothetical protein
VPNYVHPLRTFGDLAAFDLEAVVSCRCGRHGTIEADADFFRDRPIGGSAFRCTTILPLWSRGQQCTGRPLPEIRKRGRDGWNLVDHWRAMMRRHQGAPAGYPKTWRDHVHAGDIAWLSDTGCRGGYSIRMIAFDEPPWDHLLDWPIGAIVCPACQKAMTLTHACGGRGAGGRNTVSLEHERPEPYRPPRRGEPVFITSPA